MKIRIYALFLPIAIALSQIALTMDFVFDLGGVLVNTNKLRSFKYMGIINNVQYCLYCKINPLHLGDRVTNTLFSTLERVAQLHNLACDDIDCAYDEHGNMLPHLMRAWLQGAMTCDEILTLVINTINSHPEWFTHKTEQHIIAKLARMIFTPKHFIATRTISTENLNLIKEYKKNGHRVYILSNWDTESFELLKQKYPQLFSLIDGIIISGDVHALKPNKQIYQTLIARYNLNPHHCWFIDDQQENVNMAKELGFNGILYTKKNTRLSKIKKYLTNFIQKITYSKSVIRRENLNSIGISVNNTKNTSNAIIDGENISLTDSTNDNCFPANA